MFRSTRYLLIALMLVLLPLRGWAGNVMAIHMAVNMAATAVAQVNMSGVAGMASQTPMPADCTMHSQPSNSDVESTCGSCDTCELCLAVANLTPASWSANELTRHSSPLAFSASFSSAVRAPGFKPPIA